MAKQRVMDAERQKAIDLYRMMKDKKVKISWSYDVLRDCIA